MRQRKAIALAMRRAANLAASRKLPWPGPFLLGTRFVPDSGHDSGHDGGDRDKHVREELVKRGPDGKTIVAYAREGHEQVWDVPRRAEYYFEN
jgi:hypothetical protein